MTKTTETETEIKATDAEIETAETDAEITPEEKEQEINFLYGEIGNYTNLLVNTDYRARKIIDELASFIKKQFPSASLPIYEKYLADEIEAQTFRDKINECKDKIKELQEE